MSDKKNKTVGKRLRRLRKALGYRHANTFAFFLGIPASRWGNLENGYPLSKDVMFLLMQKVSGLSLDWLFFGKTDGLSVRLGQRLEEFPEDEDGPTSPRRNDTTS